MLNDVFDHTLGVRSNKLHCAVACIVGHCSAGYFEASSGDPKDQQCRQWGEADHAMRSIHQCNASDFKFVKCISFFQLHLISAQQ